jgi:hypothetical protein
MQVEYVLQAALTLQADSAVPHVVTYGSDLWMHWMHGRVASKGPQLVSAQSGVQ